MHLQRSIVCLIALIALCTALPATAQDAPPALGQIHEDQTGGISLRPPAGMERITRRGDPNRIVEFVDKDRHWALRVDRTTYDQPTVVTALPGGNPGVMDLIVEQFTRGQINVEVLRQDLVNHGPHDMGLLAMRYGAPDDR